MIARSILILSFFICVEASAQPVAPAAAADWQQTVVAAKKEGAVVISASSSELLRQVLMEFERDYPGIKVSYQSANARDFWARLEKEREVGHYLWDLRVGGASPAAYQARDRGALDPVKPLLLLPEVADDAKWLGGMDSLFADRDKKYVLRYMSSLFAGVVVDRDTVPAADFESPQALLDPRWQGRIVMQDPRGGGAGSYALAGFLRQYGEEFVRRLLSRQNVVVVDNKRQMAEWVIRKRTAVQNSQS